MVGITVDWDKAIIGPHIRPNEKPCFLSYAYHKRGKWHSNIQYIEDGFGTVYKCGKRSCDTPEAALKPLEEEVQKLADRYNQAKRRAKQLRDMAPNALRAQASIAFDSVGYP